MEREEEGGAGGGEFMGARFFQRRSRNAADATLCRRHPRISKIFTKGRNLLPGVFFFFFLPTSSMVFDDFGKIIIWVDLFFLQGFEWIFVALYDVYFKRWIYLCHLRQFFVC